MAAMTPVTTTKDLRITAVRVTPVAVPEPPLLNALGVHEPYALRSIVELDTGAGITGVGETYGDDQTLARLHAVADRLIGLDAFDLGGLQRRAAAEIGTPEADLAAAGYSLLAGSVSCGKAVAAAVAPFEVACLDVQGQAVGRPVADLLGGAVRGAVPFAGYLFYRWARHPYPHLYDEDGYPDDGWGEALDPDSIVAQAHQMVHTYGFRTLKLKGGVFPPEQEVEAILALRDAFPDHLLRLDPDANWTIRTARRAIDRLWGVLDYLEDPVAGTPGMAEIARDNGLPLATSRCVTAMNELPAAIDRQAMQIVLADHHRWGGLRATQRLAAVCAAFGIGLSMHSNIHLGVSLAAMTHVAAATPGISYACDTHWPWRNQDVIEPGTLTFRDGSVPVPTRPGLGVSLDRDALVRLHEQYLTCGARKMEDVATARGAYPAFSEECPRY